MKNEDSTQPEKPPLGLTPLSTHEDLRLIEISEAMQRYSDDGKEIPPEWVDELFDLRIKARARKQITDGIKVSGKTYTPTRWYRYADSMLHKHAGVSQAHRGPRADLLDSDDPVLSFPLEEFTVPCPGCSEPMQVKGRIVPKSQLSKEEQADLERQKPEDTKVTWRSFHPHQHLPKKEKT